MRYSCCASNFLIPDGRFLYAEVRRTDAARRGISPRRALQRAIAPIRPLLDGCHHLVIVPHGPLHFLPFTRCDSPEKYLCDDFTISYAPSATIFALFASGKRPMRICGPCIWSSGSKRAEIDAEVKAVCGDYLRIGYLQARRRQLRRWRDPRSYRRICTSRRTACTGRIRCFRGSGWVMATPIFMTCIK